MPPEVPVGEPLQFPAGDTVQWLYETSEFAPSDGWTLIYAFREEKGGGKFDVTCQQYGSGYLATISMQQSAAIRPGQYIWEARMTLGTERYTIRRGFTKVTPNLSALNFSADIRSDAKKAFDNAMEAWNAVKLGKTVSLNGRVYTQQNIADLIMYVDRCKSDWDMEKDALETAIDGDIGGDPRKIYVRFGRV